MEHRPATMSFPIGDRSRRVADTISVVDRPETEPRRCAERRGRRRTGKMDNAVEIRPTDEIRLLLRENEATGTPLFDPACDPVVVGQGVQASRRNARRRCSGLSAQRPGGHPVRSSFVVAGLDEQRDLDAGDSSKLIDNAASQSEASSTFQVTPMRRLIGHERAGLASNGEPSFLVAIQSILLAAGCSHTGIPNAIQAHADHRARSRACTALDPHHRLRDEFPLRA